MNKQSSLQPIGKFRYLLLTASILTFLLIIMGGIVRVTESGLGCPDWPTCYGQLIPPLRLDSLIEYIHRLIAALTTPFILASAIVGWWKYRAIKWVSRPPLIALIFLAIEIGLGAITVLTELPPEIVAIHLGTALTVLALMLTATVTAFSRRQNPDLPDRLSFRSPFARTTLWTLGAVFVVLVSGAVVAGSDSTRACAGWPLCNGMLFPIDIHQWIHMIHRFIVGISSILVLVVVVRAWRSQRSQTAILPAATLMGLLYLAQAFVGALKTTRDFPVFLLALHVATAAAVWAATVILVVVTGLAGRSPEDEKKEAATRVDFRQHTRDLIMMTRPVVVLLLLVTAYGGMVVGQQGIPPFGLAFWTLLGGALAAGGAQAVNMYVDRDIDRLMQRTANRPLPAGRLTPAEGLAWGLGLCTASIYIVAGFVNSLAALLVLVGILYYVIIYTLVLKRTSAQNIVIGGGAGALPPLVGFASAAGHLNLEAAVLFVLIFLWTPPHFWALAIVRLKDYARAGVPMLPVVSGEAVTRRQIMVYAVFLVVVSMVLPLLGMTGMIYLVSAALLGAWLLYAAWKVWKVEGNKVAWTLYRVSSLYLAFLFTALIADALIRIPTGL
ncbi:MAG TPA: heme o synthase [Anaerolineaceae bacterium]|nr:heme o synthase [Anaerolineaceae bacterium]